MPTILLTIQLSSNMTIQKSLNLLLMPKNKSLRVPSEVILCINITFDNNMESQNYFTKCVKVNVGLVLIIISPFNTFITLHLP